MYRKNDRQNKCRHNDSTWDVCRHMTGKMFVGEMSVDKMTRQDLCRKNDCIQSDSRRDVCGQNDCRQYGMVAFLENKTFLKYLPDCFWDSYQKRQFWNFVFPSFCQWKTQDIKEIDCWGHS